MSTPTTEIAAQAAALVVEEGLDYAAAKHKALRQLGFPQRSPLPGNEVVESCVREYLALYCSDTQPQELQTLRKLALEWMQRLQQWQPSCRIYLSGAVWHGTATRLSDIHLQLFCDDQKMLQIELLNHGLNPEVDMGHVRGKERMRLFFTTHCEELRQSVGLVLGLADLDDLRGALHPDTQGKASMGDATAISKLLAKDIGKFQ